MRAQRIPLSGWHLVTYSCVTLGLEGLYFPSVGLQCRLSKMAFENCAVVFKARWCYLLFLK